MKVVLGGSRNLNQIPAAARAQIDTWLTEEAAIMLGDASGIDSILQRLLTEIGYPHVEVFTSAPDVRHNLGGWPVVHIDPMVKSRGSAMHTAKDRAMTRTADAGLMLWDGHSAGTLANVLDLAAHRKDTYVVTDPDERLLHWQDGSGALEWAMAHTSVYDEAAKRLAQFAKRQARHEPPNPTPATDFLFDMS